MRKIFFIGMPGCGKSYLGKKIAKKLKLPFIDLDDIIINKAGKPINEIFISEGEDYFRLLEAQSLREVTNTHHDFLMATGGGAPCFHQNMDFINQQGISLFVNLSLETIATNLLSKGIEKRPLLKDFNEESLLNELREKYTIRAIFYNQAHIIINLDQRDPEKVEKVLQEYLDSYLQG